MSQKAALCLYAVHRQRLLFACMVWFTFMYFFWKLGDPFPILSPKHGNLVSLSSLSTFMPSLWLWMPFLSHTVRFFYLQRGVERKLKQWWLFSVVCFLLFRHPVHWAADQSCWCDWSHTHGSVVRIWCSQLSLHIHVLFPQVSSAVGLCWHYLQQPYNTACWSKSVASDITILYRIPICMTHASIAVMLPALLFFTEM